MGDFVISPLPRLLTKELCAAGPLCSTGVAPFQRYYGPSRHRLVFDRFPGPCGGGKEAAREAQNRGRATADGEPISEMADAGIVLLRPFLRRVDLFAGTKRRIERHRDRL